MAAVTQFTKVDEVKASDLMIVLVDQGNGTYNRALARRDIAVMAVPGVNVIAPDITYTSHATTVNGLIPGVTYRWIKGTYDLASAYNGPQVVSNIGPPGTVKEFVSAWTSIVFSSPTVGVPVDLQLIFIGITSLQNLTVTNPIAGSTTTAVANQLSAPFSIGGVPVTVSGGWIDYSAFTYGLIAPFFQGDGSLLTNIGGSSYTLVDINQTLDLSPAVGFFNFGGAGNHVTLPLGSQAGKVIRVSSSPVAPATYNVLHPPSGGTLDGLNLVKLLYPEYFELTCLGSDKWVITKAGSYTHGVSGVLAGPQLPAFGGWVPVQFAPVNLGGGATADACGMLVSYAFWHRGTGKHWYNVRYQLKSTGIPTTGKTFRTALTDGTTFAGGECTWVSNGATLQMSGNATVLLGQGTSGLSVMMLHNDTVGGWALDSANCSLEIRKIG